MVRVFDAHKEITIFDEHFNIVGHEKVDGELKTDESYRDIPMNERLKKMLLPIYKDRKKLREKQNKTFNPQKEYVFLNTIGEPYVPERLDNKIKTFINKYNLEHMTVYGLRHSFATLMSELGMDREVLREIMGHAEFETTDFYYIFISDERKKEEMRKANSKMKKSSKSKQSERNKKIGYTGKKIKRKTKKASLRISA